MKLLEVTLDQLRADLTSGPLAGNGNLFFVVDVGASNTRLGLIAKLDRNAEIHFVKKGVRSTAALKSVLEDFEQFLGESNTKRIRAAAMNIPGPTDGLVGGPIANYQGTNEEKMVRIAAFPKVLFPAGRTMLLNDLEAGAYGVVAANAYGFLGDLFAVMWSGSEATRKTGTGEPLKELDLGHTVVLAPGTGLGTACVQYHPFSDTRTVLPLEFAHTSVVSRDFNDFLKAYASDMARGDYAPEYDDICSGRGLERIYAFLSKGRQLGAGKISAAAKGGDQLALRAMGVYYGFLMKLGSQCAMGFVPKHIVVIGDNNVHNSFFFENDKRMANLKKQFLDHSMERYGFMSRVSVARQKEVANLNLIGCAYVTQLEMANSVPKSKL